MHGLARLLREVSRSTICRKGPTKIVIPMVTSYILCMMWLEDIDHADQDSRYNHYLFANHQYYLVSLVLKFSFLIQL